MDEAIRVVDALQHFEEFAEVCPANWSTGKMLLRQPEDGVTYLSKHQIQL